MNFILILLSLFLFSCKLNYVEKQNSITDVEVNLTQDSETDFIIKRYLDGKFNASKSTSFNYKLALTRTETNEGSGIGSDSFTSSFKLTIRLSAVLRDAKTNRVVFSTSISESTNYITERDSPVKDYTSKKYASKNLSIMVAEKLYNEIEEYFAFLIDEKPLN